MVWSNRLNVFWQSYTGRMVLGVLFIHVLLIPVLFYGLLFIVERNIQSQFIDQLRNNTFLYSALMKDAIEQNNVTRQREILDEVIFRGDVVLAEFVSSDSTTIHPSVPNILFKTKFREDFDFGTNGDDTYYIALDIFSDDTNERLGTLRLGYDEIPVKRQIVSAYHYGIFFAIGYLFLSMFLVIFFGQKLVKPITELRNLTQSIAGGDEDVSMDINTNIAEIKYLSSDLDTMQKILISRRHDVVNRERRLHAILDNAGDGIISINNKGIIQSFNKTAESIFGYDEEEVTGKNVSILMPSPDREQHDSYIKNYLDTGKAKIMGAGRRVQALHKSGNIIPVFLNVSKVKQGPELIFIGIIHDLSREAALESRLSQFWNAMQQSPVSIIITDLEGKIEYVNPFFCKVTGYEDFEVIGRNPNILKSGEVQTETYDELWSTITKGGIWRGVLQNRKKNGDLFWESATICPVFDNEEKITNYIALKEDITEQRMKELMLQQAMKLEVVGKMTNGIAHDFNNLLTIILGNLQYLQEIIHDEGAEEKLSIIADAFSAAHDGSRLIKQLLVFSRHQEAESEPIEIKLLLEKLKRLLNRVIPEDIGMKIGMPDKGDFVLIDPDRFESAILNLVINARDAMPDGGEININCKHSFFDEPIEVEKGYINPGRYIIISVEDTGIGISENIRNRVIEPFFSTKTSTSGTGLGLSMVFDFVTQSGGGLIISSIVHKGTIIELFLPLIEPDDLVLAENNEDKKEIVGGNESILIVEDREKVRRFASRTLSHLGYHLFEAENADKAMEYIESGANIDMLFTDVVMPGEMNGVQLADFVHNKNSKLKILLTTGMETQESIDGISMTKFPVLFKPYTVDKLARYIRDVLDAHH